MAIYKNQTVIIYLCVYTNTIPLLMQRYQLAKITNMQDNANLNK